MDTPTKPTQASTDISAVPPVVIGILIGFDEHARPLVAYADNPNAEGVPALFSAPLSRDWVGSRVALLFVNGDSAQPMIIGPVKEAVRHASVTVDNKEQLVLSAEREIVLKCGDASITLTRDGKILLRGDYISSRSSGMQTIKGGSVQIN